MRRFVRTACWLSVLLALPVATPWQAHAQAPRLTMIGAGAGVTCAEWLADGHSEPTLEQWAFGFASAIAAGVQQQSGYDPLAALDADAIHAWLENHCRSWPDERLSTALVRMVYAGVR